MLKPLEEFVCDRCGQIINNPDEGYMEWLETTKKPATDFRIVHHAPHSPYRENGGDCYHHTKTLGRSDLKLKSFVGEEGLVHLISFIDVGETLKRDYKGVSFKNGREFAELFRRVQIPYYEEARLHWHKAEQDGYFDGANEIWTYLPKNLKILIEIYGEE